MSLTPELTCPPTRQGKIMMKGQTDDKPQENAQPSGSALNELLFVSQREAKPLPDIAICGTCGWRGDSSSCEVEVEQDGWEAPPYNVHLCPVCDDGGCIDDYGYSKEQYVKWARWNHETY